MRRISGACHSMNEAQFSGGFIHLPPAAFAMNGFVGFTLTRSLRCFARAVLLLPIDDTHFPEEPILAFRAGTGSRYAPSMATEGNK